MAEELQERAGRDTGEMSEAHRSIADHPLFGWLQILLVVVAAGWAVWLAIQGDLTSAAAFAAVAVFGIVIMAAPEPLPSAFRLLLTAALFINAMGYVLNLWKEGTAFDEAVHALTSFAATAALAWLLLGRTRLIEARKVMQLVLATLAIGLVLGIAWEGVEWVIGIIGDMRDTMMDLLMDLIGAAVAGLFCAWAASLKRARAF